MNNGLERKQPNIFRVVLISLLIISFSVIYIVNLNYIDVDKVPLAIDGVLDLSQWDSKKTLGLMGQWEFYPGVLLSPDMELPSEKELIEVPGDWKNNMGDNPQGAGTYRLVIKVPETGYYGLKTKTMRLASVVYANGDKIASTGKIGYKFSEFTPESKYRFASVFSSDKEIELLIPMSSFKYKTGGIIKPIEFGSFREMKVLNDKQRAVEIIGLIALYY